MHLFFISLLSEDQLVKERVCSCRSKFLFKRRNSCLERLYHIGKQTRSHKSCSSLQQGGKHEMYRFSQSHTVSHISIIYKMLFFLLKRPLHDNLSVPVRKSVVRLTDRPHMTLDVYLGRKTTIQYNTIQKFYRCQRFFYPGLLSQPRL